VIEAAVKAIETVDECLGRVVEAVEESDGVCLVTADHGNADHMLEEDGSPNTAHSMNPVPLIVTGEVGGCAREASWPTFRRRSSTCSVSASRQRWMEKS
jgi:bisphosphoglycerate-independent phosphoglycerate mutase (AlkP superfamily)